MKLYKDTDGAWILDGGEIPAGSCRYTLTASGILTIYLLNGFAIYKGKLTDLQKEDGTYEDEADFKLGCKGFFVNPLNPLEEAVEGLQEAMPLKADLVDCKVPAE